MLRTALKSLEDQVRDKQKAVASLERDIEKKLKHIDSVKKLLREMEEPEDGAQTGASHGSNTKPSAGGAKVAARKPDSVAEEVRQVARKIILEAGKPMTQHAIKMRMDEKGVKLDVKKPVDTIRIYLNRAKEEFRRIEGEGYVVIGMEK